MMLLAQTTTEEVAIQWRDLLSSFRESLSGPEGWQQLIVAGACFLLAFLLGRIFLRWKGCDDFFHVVFGHSRDHDGDGMADRPRVPIVSVLVTLFLWAAFLILEPIGGVGHHCFLLRAFALISTAWLMFVVPSRFLRGRFVPQLILQLAFGWALLAVTGLLHPVASALDSVAIDRGDFRLSLKSLVIGATSVCALIWVAGFLSRLFGKSIEQHHGLSLSGKVLLGKVVQFALYALAVGIGFRVIGIDLTGLAVFSGALGIGLGFGLQKVIANFISGIILLLEKSVKPGDVIQVGDTLGRITALRTRYASVRTRDHEEHLIPNEQLITQAVVSLTHQTTQTRIKANIGVAYGSEPRDVIRLCEEVMQGIPRILSSPAPALRLQGFGDSSMDFELRFWIDDPANGTANVKSEVLLGVLDAFRREGIQLPFPQREIRILGNEHLPDKGSRT